MNKYTIIEINGTSTKKAAEKKIWSIGLETVLLPYLTASNAVGATCIDGDVLGCPVRIARNTDGTPKLNKSGKLVTSVHKEIRAQVANMRDAYIAQLRNATRFVQSTETEAYNNQVKIANRMGAEALQAEKDLIAKHEATLKALAEATAKAEAEATAKAEAEATAKAEAEATAKDEAQSEAENIVKSHKKAVKV
ncbi:MAG: hypothetical protein WC364_10310 [Eubacteriales bacterium]|jgi:hypothetical protein